jgi:hypothetical protein
MLSPERASSWLTAAPKPLDDPMIKPHGVALALVVISRDSRLMIVDGRLSIDDLKKNQE